MEAPDVSDRVVVITGASRGLGAGMAQAMHGWGAKLGLCARSEPVLAGGEGVVAGRLDVRDGDAMQAFAERVVESLGPIDLWINNAGVLEPIRFMRDLGAQELMDHLAINVLGVLHGSQAYARHLRAAGRGGVLINVSSGAALSGYAGWTAYCAGKAAVDRLTECAQLEEEAAGLRAYAVAPGVIDTDMQRTIRGKTPEEFPLVEKFLELKREEAFNSPEYVARHLLAIAFDPAARPDEVVVRLPPEQRA